MANGSAKNKQRVGAFIQRYCKTEQYLTRRFCPGKNLVFETPCNIINEKSILIEKTQSVSRRSANMSDYNKKSKIAAIKNGPYFVYGNVPLSEKIMVRKGHGKELVEGRKLPQAEEYHLCRCGKSKDAPFCDGSHRTNGFDGTEVCERAGFENRAEWNVGPSMDLLDDRTRCVHAGFCQAKNGSTWELAAASDHEENKSEAIRTANECPSGRLLALDKDGKSLDPACEPSVEIIQDPLKGTSAGIFVKGMIPLVSADGEPYEARNRYVLCRCGKSKNKLFCDSSHVDARYMADCEGQSRYTMTAYRNIEQVFRGDKTHWVGNGFRVANYFPSGGHFDLARFSPFVLMDYNAPFEFKPAKRPKGIGPHPHRGLETVTILFEGSLEHADNAGNKGVLGPGDVQWMSAGSGVLHKEYHEKNFSEAGGIFHVIQLWLNIPGIRKWDPPSYQNIRNAEMGHVDLPDGNGNVTVISGIYNGVVGPARTYRRLNMFVIDLAPSGKAHLNEPRVFNTGFLVVDGSVKVNETQICTAGDFVLFANEYGNILIEALESTAKVVVLSGEPINEPVVASGTFVMSTQEEIDQANSDYRSGVFGSEDF